MDDWDRRRYRGNKAWVHVGDDGRPVLDARGLASLRYKKDDPRTYSVRPEEIAPLDAPGAGPDHVVEPASEQSEDAIDVFCDGASSGNPGPAGIGAVLLWKGRRREISLSLGEATNNVAELTAVREALRAIRRPEHPVRVHVDSSYVIGVLSEGHRLRANADLVAEIRREMRRFPRVDFVKVAGHAGVPENERADALAREASRKSAT